MILAVDLAARYSAAVVLNSQDQVQWEANSGARSPKHWVGVLREAAQLFDVRGIVVEDVPYGISNQSMVKPVLRLQGMLIHELLQYEGLIEKTVFVNPASWQRTYPGVARGPKLDRELAARVAAEQCGYTPPDLIWRYIQTLPAGKKPLKRDLNPLAKSMTDHIDAFLIGKWVNGYASWDDLIATTGVQPVAI